jgi:hypothetical protein
MAQDGEFGRHYWSGCVHMGRRQPDDGDRHQAQYRSKAADGSDVAAGIRHDARDTEERRRLRFYTIVQASNLPYRIRLVS